MKMDMSAKPTGEDIEPTNEGNYSQEQMEEMLEHYIEAKKIEADPALFAMIRDFARSKHKMVEDMFTPADPAAVSTKGKPAKSLSDLKTKYNNLVK